MGSIPQEEVPHSERPSAAAKKRASFSEIRGAGASLLQDEPIVNLGLTKALAGQGALPPFMTEYSLPLTALLVEKVISRPAR